MHNLINDVEYESTYKGAITSSYVCKQFIIYYTCIQLYMYPVHSQYAS